MKITDLMIKTDSVIDRHQFEDEDYREARTNRINHVYQTFTEGFDEGVFTFVELKHVCRFLSQLVRPLDKDGGDLFLLASHADTLKQLDTICKMSRQRLVTSDAEEELEKAVPLRTG